MNKHSILFIGLDTHKEFHEIAYLEDHPGAQPVDYGRIPSAKAAVKKLVDSILSPTLLDYCTLKNKFRIFKELNN